MKLTAAILFAAVAQVSAGADAKVTLSWVAADNLATAFFEGTTATAVASGSNQVVTLPTGFFCKPGQDITAANILDASGGTASKMKCGGASVAVSGAKCSADGTKIDVTAGATCALGVAKIFVQKNIFIPNANTIVADGLKLGDATLGAGSQGIKHADSFGATQVDNGALTISETIPGKTGTLKWVGDYKAGVFDAATDKVCMYFFGYSIPKDAKCKFYAEGKTPVEKTISAAATDNYCQVTDSDTMYPITGKKYTIECDKFTAPAAKQEELAFGVVFSDVGTSKALSASFHKLPATTTAGPTLSPTKAPTAASFSASPRSATGAAGIVSAVVAYFLF